MRKDYATSVELVKILKEQLKKAKQEQQANREEATRRNEAKQEYDRQRRRQALCPPSPEQSQAAPAGIEAEASAE